MSPRPEPLKPSWRTFAWSAAYLLAVSAALYALFANWAYDDPFITYRYADNLARGLGFVYNPGERLLSTTSPLFALLLAALKALGGEVHSAATLIGVLSAAAGGLCLWALGRTWQTPWIGIAGIFLYPSFTLLTMTLGSETPLYLAFCLGAFAAFARQRWMLAAALAALAVLTRPDGALVPLVLAAAFLLRPGRPKPTLKNLPWKALALFLALSAAWLLFAWAYFGSPIPLTLAAKQHQGAMAASQRFGPGFLTLLANYNKPLYWVEAALAAAGLGVMLWKRSPWLVLLAWTGLYFAAYTLLGVSRYYWYYTPLLPGFVACLGMGLEALFQRLRRIPLRLLVLLPAALLLFQACDTWELHTRPDPRYPIYRAAGEWAATHTPPEASLGTLEVGIIGYYARRPMVDFAGLIQPEIGARLGASTTYQDAALWALERYAPDYLILHAGLYPQLEQAAAQDGYQPVHTLSGAGYAYPADLVIYACP